MLTSDRQKAVDDLYRCYEMVAHDRSLPLFDSIHIRRTLRNAIRYLTMPQSAVFRDRVLNTNVRRLRRGDRK